MFAAVIMIISGIWNVLSGLTAIFQDAFFVKLPNYAFRIDVTPWGWIHLLFGILILAAGYGLLSGATWARMTAIFLIGLNATLQFLWMPYYPFWGILVIALDIVVIWALYRPDTAR